MMPAELATTTVPTATTTVVTAAVPTLLTILAPLIARDQRRRLRSRGCGIADIYPRSGGDWS